MLPLSWNMSLFAFPSAVAWLAQGSRSSLYIYCV